MNTSPKKILPKLMLVAFVVPIALLAFDEPCFYAMNGSALLAAIRNLI